MYHPKGSLGGKLYCVTNVESGGEFVIRAEGMDSRSFHGSFAVKEERAIWFEELEEGEPDGGRVWAMGFGEEFLASDDDETIRTGDGEGQ